jgi:hypothetical protein
LRPSADERYQLAGSKDGIGVVGWGKRVLPAYYEQLRRSVRLALARDKPRTARLADKEPLYREITCQMIISNATTNETTETARPP